MNRSIVRCFAAVALIAGLSIVASASSATASAPTSFTLPVGFQPEGIDAGTIDGQPYAYVTSLSTGEIYRENLATGAGGVFSRSAPSPSIGIELDERGRLFVATGPAGFVKGEEGAGARVIDARTGRVIADYRFTEKQALVNDVTVTRDAAWFTDTINPVLYKIPFGPHGQLGPAKRVDTVPITGADVFDDKASTVDGNGISPTPDHRALIVINYRNGRLFRLDPKTGHTTRIRVAGGMTFPEGDGLTLDGSRLYIPQNTDKIRVLKLDESGSTGHLIDTITSPAFDGPTNTALSGGRLWTVNARFKVKNPKTAGYTVTSSPVP